MNRTEHRWAGSATLPVRTWALTSLLAIVVTTIGVQDIASRVTGPLHLDGRRSAEDAAVLALGERDPVRRGDTTEPTSQLVDVPVPPSTTRPAAVPARGPAPAAVEAPPSAAWEATAAASSTTRWARAADPEVGDIWRLEYLDADNTWREGYGNEADATLTSPWLDVPDGAGPLQLELLARQSIEPGLDGIHLDWTADETTWDELAFISGGDGPQPFVVRRYPMELGAAERIRLRFTMDSDVLYSTADRDLPVTGDARGYVLSSVALRRVAEGATAGELALGVPRREPPASVPPQAHAVVALSFSGINPYHVQFRDDSARAWAHPSTYLDSYPPDAIALWLSLDAPTYDEAVEADARVWEQVEPGVLYWVPGTRIIGLEATTEGIWGCDPTCGLDVEERGFGTSMTGRAAAADYGGCPTCLIVARQGMAADEVGWGARNASWVDTHVVNNFAETHSLTRFIDLKSEAQAAAARHLLITGVPHGTLSAIEVADPLTDTQNPLIRLATPLLPYASYPGGAPGVVNVGVDDHGYVHHRQDLPVHAVSPACRETRPSSRHLSRSDDVGLGTHSAASHAAGVAAEALLRIRRAIGDTRVGIHDGVAARALRHHPRRGPLADGVLTLDEWRMLVLHSAAATPPRTADEPACNSLNPDLSTPYTASLPIAWGDLPEGTPTHTLIGYGLLDASAADRAVAVALGLAPEPDRSAEDDWYEADQTIRRQDPAGG